MKKTKHVPVLLEELVKGMRIEPNQVVVDATLGGGGHAKVVTKKMESGTFFGFDVSEEAVKSFKEKLQESENKELKSVLINDNFRNAEKHIRSNGFESIDTLYADLGFSTDQLDEDLSFKKDGELDLRLDKTLPIKAKDLVNGLYEQELIKLFEVNADEKLAKPIAREIIYRRKNSLFETKKELVGAILYVLQKFKVPEHSRNGKPEARIFQALRIAVNDEFGAIKELLNEGFELLKIGGRIGIISFHSGEDRLVKRKFKTLVKDNKAKWIEELVVPTKGEIRKNRKASSAKLRIIEKI